MAAFSWLLLYDRQPDPGSATTARINTLVLCPAGARPPLGTSRPRSIR